jgi:hypothetical protein
MLRHPEVDVGLLDVGHQRATQAFPDAIEVVYLLAILLDHVLPQQGRGIHSKGANTDRLDLYQSPRRQVDAVSLTGYQERGLVGQWYLSVLHIRPLCSTVRADRGRGAPYIGVTATTGPVPVQPTHLCQPRLPLVVDAVALIEDVLQIEVELLATVRGWCTCQAVVRLSRAPVSLRHLRGVDNVLPAAIVLAVL